MQFEMNPKIGTDYSTVRFTGQLYRMKPEVASELIKLFHKLGAIKNPEYETEFYFPKHITSEVLSEVIRNTCFVCGGLMKDGQALDNTYVYFDDFGNDAGQPGTTGSKIGQPVMKQVRKCTACGHSHT